MANRPTMCQEFVAAAIEPTRRNYMDDVLISHPSESTLSLILADLTKALEAWGYCIVQEKIQKKASLSIFRASY
jgi:hypothetical protein